MPKTVLFFGDSITDANRLKEDQMEWNKAHRLGTGYVGFIAAQHLYENPGCETRLINKGIAGNRAKDLYCRLHDDVIVQKPDVISIMIGINEVWCKQNATGEVEPARFAFTYRAILDEIKEKLGDIPIVIIEPFCLPNERLTGGYDTWVKLLEPLQEASKVIAKEYNCRFVPMQEEFNKLLAQAPAEYWLWDGIHPLSAGHMAIAKAWMAAAGDLLT
ncbi:MAG: SGNH/GDSL hydrolase family protein [Defluviitaleaceae bacterium]|nr:SGNH/GDSL hydrolase family protein [Defluviitaleaceae bacterium]